MPDRAVRSLEFLEKSASTARVLNLSQIYKDHGHTPAWSEQPLFQTVGLNKTLLIKHRLRRNESDLFRGLRRVATKIVVPIDSQELKAGGRYVFFGQLDFAPTLKEVFGITPDHPDFRTLKLIDQLPSLDPFLLREQLSRAGIDPAPCYFAISEGDMQKMLTFVQHEIEPLVQLSLGETQATADSVARMAARILSNKPGDRMDGLREVLRLSPEQYEEGIFCWKGFLYFKWTLGSMAEALANVMSKVASIQPADPLDSEARNYVARGRVVVRELIKRAMAETRETMKVYDSAYSGLTQNGNPLMFRDFLLDAPRLFARLGEQLGAIQHVISFWKFRFGSKPAPPSVSELIDIFMDFETSLKGRSET
ncbi:MAG: hypothetical protein K2Y04_15290 [Caulobacteraceae bacterium]|nr:hypothetical protein [Caulobacteraceae bacterium]